MNLYDRRYLRHYNSTRQPWGVHTKPAKRRVNWWGLVLPLALLLGASVMVPLAIVALSWTHAL